MIQECAEAVWLSIVGSLVVIPEQAKLARVAGGEGLGVEVPVEVGSEVLGDLAATVMDLQEVTDLIARRIVTAAVPDVTAKKENVPCIAQHGYRHPSPPVSF